MDKLNMQAHTKISHAHESRSLNSSYADSDEDNQLSLCCLCGKTFPTIRSLHYHIDSEHGDAKCDFESDFLPEPAVIDDHRVLSSSKPVAKTELSSKLLDECNSGEIFSCPICKRNFPGQISLKVHIETIHNGHRSSTCEICQKHFSTLSYLRLHISTVHEGLKAYVCTICSKRYTQKHSLKKHILSAHGPGNAAHLLNGQDSNSCNDLGLTFSAVLSSSPSDTATESVSHSAESVPSSEIPTATDSQQLEDPHFASIPDSRLEGCRSSPPLSFTLKLTHTLTDETSTTSLQS